ncbi:hypothetical protein QLX67_11205 [Balneolaceae bacterium ANBcel3]|nr:hypothetical protein [Balneolaceae bacterium ANBcel3]
MTYLKSSVALTNIGPSESKTINGGFLPLAVIAFCKGYAAGVSVAGTVLVAANVVKKAVDDLK